MGREKINRSSGTKTHGSTTIDPAQGKLTVQSYTSTCSNLVGHTQIRRTIRQRGGIRSQPKQQRTKAEWTRRIHTTRCRRSCIRGGSKANQRTPNEQGASPEHDDTEAASALDQNHDDKSRMNKTYPQLRSRIHSG